ncbi:thermonuclease family protein, partial [Klebsiella pneumoniae]|uniref:thermonuclease family protein n=1 Tax=Klebsiella pneumoniae TaxID=573 RepID=UPI003852694E
PACIVAVHDGDTITLCDHTRVRLANIDAPELAGSPRCAPGRVRQLAHSRNPAWCDYRRGQIARDALARLLASGPPMLW